MSPNRRAFLDTIAVSELGVDLIRLSDNGYNVCVGSTPKRPILFTSYVTHPRVRCKELNSDAAGRYQFMGRYWVPYKKLLNLPDFGPDSQDKWALQLARECRALEAIDAGRIAEAIALCNSRWASFPGAGYGQPEHKMDHLIAWYEQAGGVLA